MENFFNEANIISVYTRAQAIEDGFLIDVSETAREAGFTIPVAVTAAVWDLYVFWTEEDNQRQTFQDTEGRLWDVLYMCRFAIGICKKKGIENSCLLYKLKVIPRGGKARRSKLVKLKAVMHSGDNREPVLTIMLPEED